MKLDLSKKLFQCRDILAIATAAALFWTSLPLPQAWSASADTLRATPAASDRITAFQLEATLRAPGTHGLEERPQERDYLNELIAQARKDGRLTDAEIPSSVLERINRQIGRPLSQSVRLHVVNLGTQLGLPRQPGVTAAVGLIYAYGVASADDGLDVYVTNAFYEQHLLKNEWLFAEVLNHEYTEVIEQAGNKDVRLRHRAAVEHLWKFVNPENPYGISAFQQFFLDLLAADGDTLTLGSFLPDHPNDPEGKFLAYAKHLAEQLSDRPVDRRSSQQVERPLLDNAIDPIKAEQWIRAHSTPELRVLARWLIDHTRRITQEEFEQALQESVERFNASITEPYVALTYGKDRSTDWVLRIAREQGLRPPAHVLEIGPQTSEWLINHPDITHITIVDDAAYSADQLYQKVHEALGYIAGPLGMRSPHGGELKRRLHLHLVIPVMTTQANETDELGLATSVYAVRTIPNIYELFAREGIDEDNFIRKLYERVFWSSRLPRTLTYFQHKVPDAFSFVPMLLTGEVMNETQRDELTRIPLIPETIPPYKPGYQEWATAVPGTERPGSAGLPAAPTGMGADAAQAGAPLSATQSPGQAGGPAVGEASGQELKELGGTDDADAAEGMQDQQIPVAGDQMVDVPGESAVQQNVVLGVAAGNNMGDRSDDQPVTPDRSQQPADLILGGEHAQVGARQDVGQLAEGLATEDGRQRPLQEGVVDSAGGGTAQQRGDEDVGVNDDAHAGEPQNAPAEPARTVGEFAAQRGDASQSVGALSLPAAPTGRGGSRAPAVPPAAASRARPAGSPTALPAAPPLSTTTPLTPASSHPSEREDTAAATPRQGASSEGAPLPAAARQQAGGPAAQAPRPSPSPAPAASADASLPHQAWTSLPPLTLQKLSVLGDYSPLRRVQADPRYGYLIEELGPTRQGELSQPEHWQVDPKELATYFASEELDTMRGHLPAIVAFAKYLLDREDLQGKRLVFLGRGSDLIYDAAEALTQFVPAYAKRRQDFLLFDWSSKTRLAFVLSEPERLAHALQLRAEKAQGLVLVDEISYFRDLPQELAKLLTRKLDIPTENIWLALMVAERAGGPYPRIIYHKIVEPKGRKAVKNAAEWLAYTYDSRRDHFVTESALITTYATNYGPRRLFHKMIMADYIRAKTPPSPSQKRRAPRRRPSPTRSPPPAPGPAGGEAKAVPGTKGTDSAGAPPPASLRSAQAGGPASGEASGSPDGQARDAEEVAVVGGEMPQPQPSQTGHDEGVIHQQPRLATDAVNPPEQSSGNSGDRIRDSIRTEAPGTEGTGSAGASLSAPRSSGQAGGPAVTVGDEASGPPDRQAGDADTEKVPIGGGQVVQPVGTQGRQVEGVVRQQAVPLAEPAGVPELSAGQVNDPQGPSAQLLQAPASVRESRDDGGVIPQILQGTAAGELVPRADFRPQQPMAHLAQNQNGGDANNFPVPQTLQKGGAGAGLAQEVSKEDVRVNKDDRAGGQLVEPGHLGPVETSLVSVDDRAGRSGGDADDAAGATDRILGLDEGHGDVRMLAQRQLPSQPQSPILVDGINRLHHAQTLASGTGTVKPTDDVEMASEGPGSAAAPGPAITAGGEGLTEAQNAGVSEPGAIGTGSEGEVVPAHWALAPTHGSTKMFLRFIQAHAERFRGKRGLDLGAGSGALGIAMARAGADVTAVDIVPLAVENTAANLAEETAEVRGRVRVGQSDLYERLPEITGEAQPVFDVIVSNHPVNDGEPTAGVPLSYVARAGADYRIVRGILSGLPARLAAGGVAYVHAGLGGSAHVWNEERLREEAARHGLRVELVARGTVEADDGPYVQGVFEVRRAADAGAGEVTAAIQRALPSGTGRSGEQSEKLGGADDADAAKGVQDQQIEVAGDEVVGAAVDGTLKESVVFGISAGGDVARRSDEGTGLAEDRKQLPTLSGIDSTHPLRPSEDMGQLAEQDVRSDQLKVSSGQGEKDGTGRAAMQQAAQEHVSVEDGAHRTPGEPGQSPSAPPAVGAGADQAGDQSVREAVESAPARSGAPTDAPIGSLPTATVAPATVPLGTQIVPPTPASSNSSSSEDTPANAMRQAVQRVLPPESGDHYAKVIYALDRRQQPPTVIPLRLIRADDIQGEDRTRVAAGLAQWFAVEGAPIKHANVVEEWIHLLNSQWLPVGLGDQWRGLYFAVSPAGEVEGLMHVVGRSLKVIEIHPAIQLERRVRGVGEELFAAALQRMLGAPTETHGLEPEALEISMPSPEVKALLVQFGAREAFGDLYLSEAQARAFIRMRQAQTRKWMDEYGLSVEASQQEAIRRALPPETEQPAMKPLTATDEAGEVVQDVIPVIRRQQ